jgi:long-chain acyl-CoA synthetase
MNAPKAYKFGSVGKPVEQTRIVIDKSVNETKRDDGEIVVYGPQVMMGYYNKPEETKKVLQEDGGLRTGDRGRVDEEGYLFITGRIKEQYKLQNGKYIFPAAIEEDIKTLPYVANAMVHGDGKEYNVCLIVLDSDNIHDWAEEMQLEIHPEGLIATLSKPGSELKKFLSNSISHSLKGKYHRYEIPRKYMFITEDFTHENNMLTQTMKIKRRSILKKYEVDLEQLYD